MSVEIPGEWQLSTLGEVVELQRGFDLPAHARRWGPYPVLTSGDGGGWHDEGPIQGPGFVVGRATNLGKPKWSDRAYWPHNTTMFARDFKGNDPRWLFHLFESIDFSGFDSGSVQPMLNRNYIAQVRVLVPPLAEQRAIAEVLRALDDKIAANTALASTAEQFLRTEIDSAWLEHPDRGALLSDFVVLNPPTPKPLDSEPLYVDMKKLPESGWSIEAPDRRVAKGGARFQRGDTLLARITPCLENRKTGYVDNIDVGETAIGSTEFVVLRARDGVASPIAFLLATEARFREFAIQRMVGTSGRQRVAASDLARFEVPKPDERWLADFGERALSLFAQTESLHRENQTLAATRDALLPQLMSGKLRVRDAERRASEAGA